MKILDFKRANHKKEYPRKRYLKIALIEVIRGLFTLATFGHYEWLYMDKLHTHVLFDE